MTTLTCYDVSDQRPTRRLTWRGLAKLVPRLLWRMQQRRRDRMTLLTMSERMLRDVGISRLEADQAAREIELWR